MTIKTLEYIHKLLIEREAAARAECNAARKQLNDDDSKELETGVIINGALAKEHEDTACSCMKAHSEARDALKDFESAEW